MKFPLPSPDKLLYPGKQKMEVVAVVEVSCIFIRRNLEPALSLRQPTVQIETKLAHFSVIHFIKQPGK